MVFIELVTVYSTITGLPWSIYSTFVLEDRHGFNQQVSKEISDNSLTPSPPHIPQTASFFIKDQLKRLALQLVLIPPIFLGLLYTIQSGGRAFFIYAWIFLAAVTFVRYTHSLIIM